VGQHSRELQRRVAIGRLLVALLAASIQSDAECSVGRMFLVVYR
jgi:hypothetical protein